MSTHACLSQAIVPAFPSPAGGKSIHCLCPTSGLLMSALDATGDKNMKIGIIGTGNLGRAIGLRFDRLGHDVFFGARRVEEREFAVSQSVGPAKCGSVDEAAAHGDILFWMMRETKPDAVLQNPSALGGKILVDPNNRPFSGETDEGTWFGPSFGEELKANLPNVRYVKALTSVSMFTFDMPIEKLKAADAQTFVAGSDSEAKQAVTALFAEAGLRSMDLGTGPVALRAAEALGNVLRLMMANGTLPENGQIAVTVLPSERLNQIGGHRPSSYLKTSVHARRLPHLTRD